MSKIFEVHPDGEWVVAENARQACRFYRDHYGMNRWDCPFTDIRELTEDELDTLIFVDDFDEPDSNERNRRTFREELAERSHENLPYHFAISESLI